VGEQFTLTDGKCGLWPASIISHHKKNCGIRVLERLNLPHRPANVSIAISLVKNISRFEWFLEKASEIGVTEIIPLVCHRTEKTHFRYERMAQILVSAMLQSQQSWLPKLHDVQSFQAVVQQGGFDKKWIAHCLPAARQSLREKGPAQTKQLLLIGPEGDFTPDEIQTAMEAGFNAVILGETRLRTETAGIVGATLLCIG